MVKPKINTSPSFVLHYERYVLIGILILGLFFRLYDFGNRFGLAYDQARDVLVSRQAVRTGQIPLIGPFSSGGAFVVGPEWYWLVMSMSLVNFNSVLTPWIIQALLSAFIIFVMYGIGKRIRMPGVGLLAALFTAISPAQVSQSINLSVPSMVGIISFVVLYYYVRFLEKNSDRDALFLGLAIGMAINTHFQAFEFMVLIPIGLVFGRRKGTALLLLSIGLFVPFIPLMVFDFLTNHYETRNILEYVLVGQYRTFIPNRWVTYIGVFWPAAWAKIIGGLLPLGYILPILIGAVGVSGLFFKKISREIIILAISFFAMIVILRYYRGPRYDSYLVFLHPFILFLTSWALYRVYTFQRLFGIFCILLVVSGSLWKLTHDMVGAVNTTKNDSESIAKLLTDKYKDRSFAIYDYSFHSASRSYPLVLYLDQAGKIADDGLRIGFANIASDAKVNTALSELFPRALATQSGMEIYDLSGSTSSMITSNNWAFVNPSEIYRTTELWWKDKKF